MLYRSSLLLSSALVIAVFTPLPASAQSNFIIDQTRPDRAVPKAQSVPDMVVPKADTRLTDITPFTLKAVRITGSSLPAHVMGQAAKPFIGQKVDAAAIGKIANTLSALYGDEGDIAFYSIIVPKQDFQDGVLTLAIYEGYIEHVNLTGDTDGRLELISAYAEKFLQEKPLKRSSFQRTLSLIRDIPGLTVEPQLVQGHAPGAVHLMLPMKRKRSHFEISINDRGNDHLGRVQLQVSASLNGLLREGEVTQITLGAPANFSRYQYVGFSESQPIGSNGTRAQFSFGYLRTRPKAPSIEGDAKTIQFLVSHPLIRSFEENLMVSGSVDGIDSSNALFGETIANERIRAVRLSGAYSLVGEKTALAVSANLGLGMAWLGANTALPGAVDLDFKKIVLRGNYSYAVDEAWIARFNMGAQLAFNRLPVTELYALGVGSFGTAYDASAVMGDTALAGTIELAHRPKYMPALLQKMEAFVFAERGGGWYRARLGLPSADYQLTSAGLGVRLPFREKTVLEVTASHAVAADAPNVKVGKWRLGFALTTVN